MRHVKLDRSQSINANQAAYLIAVGLVVGYFMVFALLF